MATIKGRPHIILEHISGPEGLEPDLKSWIEHKRLTLPTSIEFGLHIALGMQHATQRVPGLVHRDLKPANILVTHDGCAWHDDERMLPALVHRLAGRDAGPEAPLADLRRMMDALRDHLPGLAVEGYHARKEPDNRVGFVRVG